MKIIVNQSYSLREKAFNPDYLQILEKEILSSPYLGASQLSESFSGTKGFSLVFKTNGIEQVKQDFPFLKPYLKTALKPTCNVFYLNPLIIKEGGKVEDHVDCSLQGYVQGRTIPDYVSVMYVKVPSDLEGGELVLKRGKFSLATIQPKENALLYFQGNLTHSVNQVKSSKFRISLVCEQYTLDENKLAKIPVFKLESHTSYLPDRSH